MPLSSNKESVPQPDSNKETSVNGPGEQIYEKFIKKSGIDQTQIDPNQRAKLITILNKYPLNSDTKIEEQEETLNEAVNQLTAWGFKPNNIDRATLVIESPKDEKATQINERLAKGEVPTPYESSTKIYGFDTEVNGNTMTYEEGPYDKFVKIIENFILTLGDTGGGNILSALFRSPIRTKSDISQIEKNINELGLTDNFKINNGKIEENIEDVKSGAMLNDLLRPQGANKTQPEFLKNLDQNSALQQTALMLRRVHLNSNPPRGVGEVLANDIVLQVKDGKISGARLSLPDMAYSDSVEAEEQQARDLLDLCFSIASAGFQSGEDEKKGSEIVSSNIQTILSTYGIRTVKNRALQLLGQNIPAETIHNLTRYGFDRVSDKSKKYAESRKIIEEELKK